MKRVSNIYSQICEWKNLELAYYKACQRKHLKNEIYFFNMYYYANMNKLRNSLLDGSYHVGEYRHFNITDPKPRLISAAPFEDRIVHHAIINILEPIFEGQFIYHTYGCRKGKGTHAAIRTVQKKSKSYKYFLKLDVKKFFDNINHSILKNQLKKIIKDVSCLELLYKIIDSYSITEGLAMPIGNLTSQFFANLYLSELDHHILELIKPCAYVRYMDDIIIFDNNIMSLKIIYKQIKIFLNTKLALELKNPIYGKSIDGVPFLGRLILNYKINLLREKYNQKQKKIRLIIKLEEKNIISQNKAAQRINAIKNY